MKNINQTINNFQVDRKHVRNWLKDEEKIRSFKHLKKSCRYGKAKFPFKEKKHFTQSFLIWERKVNVSSVGGLTPKQELVKERYPDEVKLSHRWFEDFYI